MSFVNAGRAIQRFIIDKQYAVATQESILAVLDARQYNTTIREEMDDFLFAEGKLRKLKISYYPIQCGVTTDTRPTSFCQTGTVAEPKQEWFEIADFIATNPQRLSVSDIRLVDANFTVSQHAMAQINSIMGDAETELAKAITTKIIANKGVHLDGSEFGSRITMSNTTSGLITPLGYWTILREQNDAAYTNIFILGSTEVWNWRQAYAIADVNTTLGQDFRKAGIQNLYYDVNLNTIQGVDAGDPEYILTFDPQALKFVSYARNVGIFATDYTSVEQLDAAYAASRADYIKGSFFSPRYGILWDFYARYVPCGDGVGFDGAWDWFLMLEWDIVFPQIQACNPEGVNGIMLYKTCPVVIPPCPSGDAMSPNIPTSTWSWTPGSIYGAGLLVANITIGNKYSEPGTVVHNIAQLAALLNDAYVGQAVFEVSGGNITYEGYTSLSGNINSGSIAITFAI